MMENVITLKGLKKSFSGREIIKGIDLEVKKNDVISVIGSSGSGKSTMLRCINLLEETTSGDILFHGESVIDGNFDINEYRSKIVMVFQQFNLFNNMTVLDNCVRPQTVVFRAQTLDGEFFEFECGGLLGRCIQHELDHLDGFLFTDRLAPDVERRIRGDLNRLKNIGQSCNYRRISKK